jgi:uncharacterized protein (TIGR04141 family)
LISLTIYLLRPDRVAVFEKEILAGRQVFPLAPPLEGIFLPIPSTPHEPPWVDVVRSSLQTPSLLSMDAQTPAGLLVVHRGNGTFVVTFGHAWQKLEDDWVEGDYGRRVALNSIRRDQLVEIRAEQVFAKWHIANERAPRASSVDEFGVEFERDLVGVLEGLTSESSVLGKSIRGGISLRVKVPFSELNAVLDKSSTLFASDDYKKVWPEVDNVSSISDQLQIDKLNLALDADLASGQAQKKIAMFTPAYKRDDGSPVDSYVFGPLLKSAARRPYLMIDSWISFLASRQRASSVTEAKNTPIHLLDESQDEIRTVSAFQCFGYELMLDGRVYVLSAGIWYEVNGKFLSSINSSVKGILGPKVPLPSWNQVESEGEYNLRCAQNPAFLFFDARNIHFGGGQSKFEFCDLLHLKSRTLYFAKIPSKSSGMSHLVEQVRRTAELFFSIDNGYRKELLKVFTKHHPHVDTSWLASKPRNGDWNLCLVSLGKQAMQLPFFGRCGLRRAYKDLRERGHEVFFLQV